MKALLAPNLKEILNGRPLLEKHPHWSGGDTRYCRSIVPKDATIVSEAAPRWKHFRSKTSTPRKHEMAGSGALLDFCSHPTFSGGVPPVYLPFLFAAAILSRMRSPMIMVRCFV